MWKQFGKPRGDVSEGDMRTSRLKIKYTLRQGQNNDKIMRADALARSLYCKDFISFWKGVSGMNSSRFHWLQKWVILFEVRTLHRCGRITFPLYSVVFIIS